MIYISAYTTVLVHKETRERLMHLRDYARESYDEVINKLITIYEKLKSEGELTEETKKSIEVARAQLRQGKGVPLKQVMKELGI